jgi:hypothetical protein
MHTLKYDLISEPRTAASLGLPPVYRASCSCGEWTYGEHVAGPHDAGAHQAWLEHAGDIETVTPSSGG